LERIALFGQLGVPWMSTFGNFSSLNRTEYLQGYSNWANYGTQRR